MGLCGIERRSKEWENGKKGIIPEKVLEEFAESKEKGSYKIREFVKPMAYKDGVPSIFDYRKWKWLVYSPYMFSNKCCAIMKKAPVHKYTKETGRKPMTAQMAFESRLRTQKWLQNGCNGFDLKSPISNPMAFWTEQDVLLYIRKNKIPICSVYGEIRTDDEEVGQLNFSDFGLYELDRPVLHTTGCSRTGCVFCGFGCHMEKPGNGRFERLKETHPTLHKYILKPWSEGGLGYKEVIDWINEHGGYNIKY